GAVWMAFLKRDGSVGSVARMDNPFPEDINLGLALSSPRRLLPGGVAMLSAVQYEHQNSPVSGPAPPMVVRTYGFGPDWLPPTVTTSADDGVGSLRQAAAHAEAHRVIRFDPSLNGQTITLSGPQIMLDGILEIDATALPDGVAIDATGNSRHFVVAT